MKSSFLKKVCVFKGLKLILKVIIESCIPLKTIQPQSNWDISYFNRRIAG